MKKLTWLLFFFSLSVFSATLESMHKKENSSSKSSINKNLKVVTVEKNNRKSSDQSKRQSNIMMLYQSGNVQMVKLYGRNL